MLIGAVNPLGLAMDTQLNDMHLEEYPDTPLEVSNDINNYNNLKQDDDDEETLISNNNGYTINIPNNNDKENQSLRRKKIIREASSINNNKKKCNFTAKELCLYLIEKSFNKLTDLLHLIGPIFCITIITFLLYTYISGIKNILPYWQKYYYKYEPNKKKYIFIKTIISIELFYTLFNFILACIIKPGSVKDIRNSKYYQTHSPYYSNELIFPYYNNDDMEKGIKNNTKKIKWPKCRKCKEIKPLRTHHCSICGTCNFKMDHHCPWINNCVGQNNHRYFLLFLLHIFFYTITMGFLALPILFNKKKNILFDDIYSIPDYNKRINIKDIKYIGILAITGFFVEIFFNSWNWYLAINGNTVLEFWAERTDYRGNSNEIISFTFGSWRKNLFYIFGTSNLMKIIFIPSIKKLPFSGLELSKFIDPNFHIDCLNE